MSAKTNLTESAAATSHSTATATSKAAATSTATATSTAPSIATAQDIALAAQVLDEGGLVAFPTETVYGLGADASSPEAVARIYAAKGRPSSHPVIVHVAPDADLSFWAAKVPDEAKALIRAFWPGPLTLILKRSTHTPSSVSGGQDSVGLRCPSHPVAQALLRAFADRRGGHAGVAGPSANRFGHVSPTQAVHVKKEFPDLVAQGMPVLDGGPSEVGIESTIVDLSRLDQGMGPVLLRPGQITADQLSEVLGLPVLPPDLSAPRVSGALKSHYAPKTPLKLVARAELLQMASHPERVMSPAELSSAKKIAVVSHSLSHPPAEMDSRILWSGMPNDPIEYGHVLYTRLRLLDESGADLIAWEDVPKTQAWAGIWDRLSRAAAAH